MAIYKVSDSPGQVGMRGVLGIPAAAAARRCPRGPHCKAQPGSIPPKGHIGPRYGACDTALPGFGPASRDTTLASRGVRPNSFCLSAVAVVVVVRRGHLHTATTQRGSDRRHGLFRGSSTRSSCRRAASRVTLVVTRRKFTCGFSISATVRVFSEWKEGDTKARRCAFCSSRIPPYTKIFLDPVKTV